MQRRCQKEPCCLLLCQGSAEKVHTISMRKQDLAISHRNPQPWSTASLLDPERHNKPPCNNKDTKTLDPNLQHPCLILKEATSPPAIIRTTAVQAWWWNIYLNEDIGCSTLPNAWITVRVHNANRFSVDRIEVEQLQSSRGCKQLKSSKHSTN